MAINGIVALALHSPNVQLDVSRQVAGLQVFFQIVSIFGAIGVAVLAQGTIVGEKQLGTAAWVLSKPISRTAFFLAKLAALGLGIGATTVGLQGAVTYIQISLVLGESPAFGPFLAGLALTALHLLFYLTLVLMLGTLFNSRGPVIGIALAVLFGQQIGSSFLGPLAALLPDALGQIAPMVAQGEASPTYVPIASTTLLSGAFVSFALWRFGGEEL